MADHEAEKLLFVWTSGDRDVALKMVFMYVSNAKKHGWWDEVHLLVWGPSQQLLTQDEELQRELSEMMERGVRVGACRACADSYPVTDELEALGVDVFYSGQFLTDWIRSDGAVMTF